MPLRAALLAATLIAATPALSDAVSDAIAAAAAAYDTGDLTTTATQLSLAGKAISATQSAKLLAHFPAAPSGWTRAENSDLADGMPMIGDGAGAEVTYVNAQDASVTISAFADNSMVDAMVKLFANPAMIEMMGGTTDIAGARFIVQDGATQGLIGNRVMLQAYGEDDQVKQLLGLFDFAAVAQFDAP